MARYFPIYMVLACFACSMIVALNDQSNVELGTQRFSQNDTLLYLKSGVPLGQKSQSLSTIKDDRLIFALLGIINNVVGFVSGALGIVDFFRNLFGSGADDPSSGLPPPKPSKYTVDQVMETMQNEFVIVKQALGGVYAVMDKQSVLSYVDVEVAINGAMNDMKFNSSVQLDIRAVELYDQVEFFLLGMLGKNTIGPDILKAVRGFTKCTDMFKVISTYVEMVDLGLAGIAYYHIRLNKMKEGIDRIDVLIKQRNHILYRVKSIEESCSAINATKVGDEVTKVLTKLGNSSLDDVSRALYAKFSDLYVDSVYWLFFVTNGFPNIDNKAAGWEGYDESHQGKVILGTRTVFWSGSPWNPDPVNPYPVLDITGDIINKALSNVHGILTSNMYQANRIREKLGAAISASNPKRPPTTIWVFVDATDSTIGNPFVGPNMFYKKVEFYLNYQKRSNDIHPKYKYFSAIFIIQ